MATLSPKGEATSVRKRLTQYNAFQPIETALCVTSGGHLIGIDYGRPRVYICLALSKIIMFMFRVSLSP